MGGCSKLAGTMTDLPGAELPRLQLKRHEDKRIRGGHAWVFSNEIDTAVTPLPGIAPGAVEGGGDPRGDFLGHAIAKRHALTGARIMSREEQLRMGRGLFAAGLASALALRERYCGGQ